MSLQGPFVVIADSPAPDVIDALRAAGGFPIIEANWTDAQSALSSVEPEAVVLAESCPDRVNTEALAGVLGEQRNKTGGLYTPVIARIRDDEVPPIPDALAIATQTPPARLVRRLTAA